MRIHILDRAAIDAGDLCWDSILQCGDVTVYDHTTSEDFRQHAGDAEALVVVGLEITGEMMDQCPNLKFINLLSTGYDFVDVAAAGERGILVSNVPVYGTDSVAQFVYALLLELCHQPALHSQAVREGQWQEKGGFSFWLRTLVELKDKTLGIVGIGRIGRAVANIGAAFGMKILTFDEYAPPAPEGAPYEMTTLERVLSESDFVTLHCPLTEQTRELINKKTLAMMKPGALLINAARGGLVNEQDLCDALASGHLGGAGLDVAASEPVNADSPLLRAPNLILTPHIAWATKEARTRMICQAAENQLAFQRGEPIHVVNG